MCKVDYLSSLALTDRYRFPAAFPSIEADSTVIPPIGVPYCVYRRGTPISIEITIKNPNSVPTIGTFKFRSGVYTRFSGQTYAQSDHEEPITVPANGGMETVTVTLSNMPDMVTKGQLTATVEVVPTQGGALLGALSQKIFLTDENPTGLQSTPWVEVLEDACAWGNGGMFQNVVAEKVTKGLLASGFFYYEPADDPNYWTEDEESGEVTYKLSELIRFRGGFIVMDCQDISGYLHIAMSAVGVSNTIERETPQISGLDDVYFLLSTNPVCRSGVDFGSLSNYAGMDFEFHQIVKRAAVAYDSAAAHRWDPDGATYMHAPAGWPINDYWQKPNPTWPTSTPRFFGLVNGHFIPGPPPNPEPDTPVGRIPSARSISVLE